MVDIAVLENQDRLGEVLVVVDDVVVLGLQEVELPLIRPLGSAGPGIEPDLGRSGAEGTVVVAVPVVEIDADIARIDLRDRRGVRVGDEEVLGAQEVRVVDALNLLLGAPDQGGLTVLPFLAAGDGGDPQPSHLGLGLDPEQAFLPRGEGDELGAGESQVGIAQLHALHDVVLFPLVADLDRVLQRGEGLAVLGDVDEELAPDRPLQVHVEALPHIELREEGPASPLAGDLPHHPGRGSGKRDRLVPGHPQVRRALPEDLLGEGKLEREAQVDETALLAGLCLGQDLAVPVDPCLVKLPVEDEAGVLLPGEGPGWDDLLGPRKVGQEHHLPIDVVVHSGGKVVAGLPYPVAGGKGDAEGPSQALEGVSRVKEHARPPIARGRTSGRRILRGGSDGKTERDQRADQNRAQYGRQGLSQTLHGPPPGNETGQS